MKYIKEDKVLTYWEARNLSEKYMKEKYSYLDELANEFSRECQIILDFLIPKPLISVMKKYPSLIKIAYNAGWRISSGFDDKEVTARLKNPVPFMCDENSPIRFCSTIYVSDFIDKIPEDYRVGIENTAIELSVGGSKMEAERSLLSTTLRNITLGEIHLSFPEVYKIYEREFNQERNNIKTKLEEMDKKIKEAIK